LGQDVVPNLVAQQSRTPSANHDDAIPISHLGLVKAATPKKRERSVSFANRSDDEPILRRGPGRPKKQIAVK